MLADAVQATGKMFEEEHLRMISLVTAVNPGGNGASHRVNKAIMEHKVIMNLRMVNGDESLFRQWHHKFIFALNQLGGAHEEIIL